MTDEPTPVKALLDTATIFPAILRDVLLTLAEDGLYNVFWTEKIFEELRNNLIKDLHLQETKVDYLLASMKKAFPDAMLDNEFEKLIPFMPNHPKDRHVLAAAKENDLDVIVTPNLKDFPKPNVSPEYPRTISPDAFLTELLSTHKNDVVNSFVKQLRAYKNPPLSQEEVLQRLAKSAPQFAAQMRRELGL
jgi:superfamily I DNA and/or RNA helicase